MAAASFNLVLVLYLYFIRILVFRPLLKYGPYI